MDLGLNHGGYSLEGGRVQLGAATNRTSHHASFKTSSSFDELVEHNRVSFSRGEKSETKNLTVRNQKHRT